MLLVAVDIGNTRAHIGTFQVADGKGARLVKLLPVSHGAAADARFFTHPQFAGGTYVYASVNPWAEARFAEAVVKAGGAPPLRLGRDFPCAVRNRAKHPETVGLDRLANASAAWARARRACVVVDLGTAVTFDVVNGRGDFLGGMIAPGLQLQAQALRTQTAQLPPVAPVRARRAIGRHTEEAIQAGISFGVAGLVEVGLKAIRRELGVRPRVYGTGGDAALFRDLFDEVVPELTLEGVARSYLAAHERRRLFVTLRRGRRLTGKRTS